MLEDCLKEGTQILKDNKEQLQMMHDALMELETIDSDVVDAIMLRTFNLDEYIATVVKREHEMLEAELLASEAEVEAKPEEKAV